MLEISDITLSILCGILICNPAARVNPPLPHPGGINFTHSDFAMLCARSGLERNAESWFYTSTDRCNSWEGPFILPMFGENGIAARTDYVISNPNKVTLLLTSTKPNGKEGRVFCAETIDSGESFKFISWLNEMPDGFEIMPSSVVLDSGEIITAVRSRNSAGNKNWIDLYKTQNRTEKPFASHGNSGFAQRRVPSCHAPFTERDQGIKQGTRQCRHRNGSPYDIDVHPTNFGRYTKTHSNNGSTKKLCHNSSDKRKRGVDFEGVEDER